MPYEVELMLIPEQPIAGIRERGPLGEIGTRIRRLRAALEGTGFATKGALMARFFEDDSASPSLDYEVCLPIDARADGSVPDRIGEARTDIIPTHLALVTTHVGRHSEMQPAYAALLAESATLGYAIAGPATEVYLTGAESVADPAEYVTEVRLPVAR